METAPSDQNERPQVTGELLMVMAHSAPETDSTTWVALPSLLRSSNGLAGSATAQLGGNGYWLPRSGAVVAVMPDGVPSIFAVTVPLEVVTSMLMWVWGSPRASASSAVTLQG